MSAASKAAPGPTEPAGRRLDGPTLAFAEIEPGDWLDIGERTVTAADIDAFAELTGDRFEIHMSDEAAQRHGFHGRVAHGLLVLSLVDGMKNRAASQFPAVASLGWEMRFARPVLAGDTIRGHIEIVAKRPTKNPARGILGLRFVVTNQDGEIVQSGVNQLMVTRGAAGPDGA